MSKKEAKYSLHHLVPSSRGWETNYLNTEMIKETTHRAIHTLFSNQVFAEKLVTMVNLDAKVLRPDVVEQLMEILEVRGEDLDNRYKEWCLYLPKHK